MGLGPGIQIYGAAVEGVAVLRCGHRAGPEVGLKVARKGHGTLTILAGGLIKLKLRRQCSPEGGLARAGVDQLAQSLQAAPDAIVANLRHLVILVIRCCLGAGQVGEAAINCLQEGLSIQGPGQAGPNLGLIGDG
ncbi:MAG: hypothetical protein ACKO63_07295 [Nodosilinea sp.]